MTTCPPLVSALLLPWPEMAESVGGRKARPGPVAGHAAAAWLPMLRATRWLRPTPAAVVHVMVVCAVAGACTQPVKESSVPAAPPNLTKVLGYCRSPASGVCSEASKRLVMVAGPKLEPEI